VFGLKCGSLFCQKLAMCNCDSTMCTCLVVKRELAAENMLLKQQLKENKRLVRILKKESMLHKA
jgi:hypothetical protein